METYRTAGVRLGLRFMQLGILSTVISVSVAALSEFSRKAEGAHGGIVWLLGFGVLLPSLLFCVGSLLSLMAPAEAGVRRYAVLMLGFSGLLLVLVVMAIPFFILVPVIAIAAFCSGLLLHVCFALFLNRLSKFAGRDDLDRRTTRLLTGFILVPLATWGVSMIAALVIPAPTLRHLAWVWGAAALWFSIWCLTTISSVARSLHAGKKPPSNENDLPWVRRIEAEAGL